MGLSVAAGGVGGVVSAGGEAVVSADEGGGGGLGAVVCEVEEGVEGVLSGGAEAVRGEVFVEHGDGGLVWWMSAGYPRRRA